MATVGQLSCGVFPTIRHTMTQMKYRPQLRLRLFLLLVTLLATVFAWRGAVRELRQAERMYLPSSRESLVRSLREHKSLRDRTAERVNLDGALTTTEVLYLSSIESAIAEIENRLECDDF